MLSPVKERHRTTVGTIHSLLRAYVIRNKLGRVASEKTLIALKRNDYDRTADAAGRLLLETGRSRAVYGRPMKFPAPDLVVDVLSKGTTRTDYAANGIAEYWIVNPGNRFVEQYVLDAQTGEYAFAGIFTGQDELTTQQVADFRSSALSLFDEAANMMALF